MFSLSMLSSSNISATILFLLLFSPLYSYLKEIGQSSNVSWKFFYFSYPGKTIACNFQIGYQNPAGNNNKLSQPQ